MLDKLILSSDKDYIASLNDDKIVDLFLQGDPLLKHETNVDSILCFHILGLTPLFFLLISV